MISIITPTYNRCELLKVALNSVLAQTFTDFEYIIVDDGSTDSTGEEIKRCRDPRVKYIYESRTGSISRVRNRGLGEARGKIVAFLDSDDYWHPGYLEELQSIYENPAILSVISNAVVFHADSRHRLLHSDKLKTLSGPLVEAYLLNDDFVIYPSCFSFRYSGHERLNEKQKHGENGLILQVLAAGEAYICMRELVFIRKHEFNISGEKDINSLFVQGYNEEFTNLDLLRAKKLVSRKVYKKTYSHYLFKQAENLYAIGLKGKAWETYLRSFLKYPLKIRGLLRAMRWTRFIYL